MLATVLPSTINAQESTATTPAVLAVDATSDTQSLSAELRRLKTQYRGELEEYRRLESQYVVAKQQYVQLQTLSSLEAAVRATQAAMEARDRVLRTYLQILKVSLLQQTGIEVGQKEAALLELDIAIGRVEKHHLLFEKELDKVALAAATTDFEEIGGKIEDTSYKVLSLLAIGKLQSVYDKATVLGSDMKTVLATEGGALKQSQRQRAFDETDRALGDVKTQLQAVQQQLTDHDANQSKSAYEELKDDIRGVYTRLAQVVSFLKELVTI